jgi:sarcosine oxidase subunit gamma
VTDLIPTTAFGDTAPRAARFGALSIAEDCTLGLASLALRKGQAAPTPFGLTLPKASGAIRQGDIGAFWIGPDQWMIELPGQAETDVAARVRAEAEGCSVSEQTDGFAVFEIASEAGGAPIDTLLSRLVNVDTRDFRAGRVTRTGMEHMTVFVIRREEDRLAVIGMRSFAGALWHALETAAKRLENKT